MRRGGRRWKLAVSVIIAVAMIAAGGIAGCRAEERMSLVERVERKEWRVVREMTGAPPDAIEAIAALITSPDREVRTLAVTCLDEVGGPVARRAFLTALDDREEDVRDKAVQAMGNHPAKEDLPEILPRIKAHPDEFVRERLALIVGRIGDPGAIEALKEARRLGQPKEVVAAIQLAMARLGHPESREAALKRLEAPEVEVRRAALEDFVYLGDATAASRVVPLLDDRREARTVGRKTSEYSLRVCDLALDALGNLLGEGIFPFPTGQFHRYTDEEIPAAKRILATRPH